MLTEEETARLTLFLIREDIEKSPEGQERTYQDLREQYEGLRQGLTERLDDRRVELLEELLELRDRLEYERCLHYLNRVFVRGKKKSGEPGKIP